MTNLVCWEKNKREKTSIDQSEQKEEKRGKREKYKNIWIEHDIFPYSNTCVSLNIITLRIMKLYQEGQSREEPTIHLVLMMCQVP